MQDKDSQCVSVKMQDKTFFVFFFSVSLLREPLCIFPDYSCRQNRYEEKSTIIVLSCQRQPGIAVPSCGLHHFAATASEGRKKKNLCTIFWLTRCHLLVRHGNNAQGSDSLTARSLRRNAGEAADAPVFNGNGVRDFFLKKICHFSRAALMWHMETIKWCFFPPFTCRRQTIYSQRSMNQLLRYLLICKCYAAASVRIYISQVHMWAFA